VIMQKRSKIKAVGIRRETVAFEGAEMFGFCHIGRYDFRSGPAS
jgi:hypothetical protein